MAKNEVIERFAIQDLLARYAHAIDDLNPEEWARCFTPDGVFQLGSQALRGHAALRAYGEVHVREIRCRHMTGNFLYKIDGNKATYLPGILPEELHDRDGLAVRRPGWSALESSREG